MGFIGGGVGYRVLKWMARPRRGGNGRAEYQQHNKVETLLGPDVWERIRGRTVIDFGCAGVGGTGGYAAGCSAGVRF